MAKRVTYKPNFASMGRLMRSPGMQAMCVAAAERAVPYAQSISPHETGEYSRAFRVVGLAVAGRRSDRAGAKLVNYSAHAAAVEWRLGFRVLGRTVDYIERTGP